MAPGEGFSRGAIIVDNIEKYFLKIFFREVI